MSVLTATTNFPFERLMSDYFCESLLVYLTLREIFNLLVCCKRAFDTDIPWKILHQRMKISHYQTFLDRFSCVRDIVLHVGFRLGFVCLHCCYPLDGPSGFFACTNLCNTCAKHKFKSGGHPYVEGIVRFYLSGTDYITSRGHAFVLPPYWINIDNSYREAIIRNGHAVRMAQAIYEEKQFFKHYAPKEIDRPRDNKSRTLRIMINQWWKTKQTVLKLYQLMQNKQRNRGRSSTLSTDNTLSDNKSVDNRSKQAHTDDCDDMMDIHQYHNNMDSIESPPAILRNPKYDVVTNDSDGDVIDDDTNIDMEVHYNSNHNTLPAVKYMPWVHRRYISDSISYRNSGGNSSSPNIDDQVGNTHNNNDIGNNNENLDDENDMINNLLSELSYHKDFQHIIRDLTQGYQINDGNADDTSSGSSSNNVRNNGNGTVNNDAPTGSSSIATQPLSPTAMIDPESLPQSSNNSCAADKRYSYLTAEHPPWYYNDNLPNSLLTIYSVERAKVLSGHYDETQDVSVTNPLNIQPLKELVEAMHNKPGAVKLYYV